MRIILFLLLSNICLAQGVFHSMLDTPEPTPVQIGDLLNDTDFSNFGTDYTNNAADATSVSVVSTELVVTKNNSTNPSSNNIYYSAQGSWMFNNKYVHAIYRHTTALLATSAGAGVGWKFRVSDGVIAPYITNYQASVFAFVSTNTASGSYKKLLILRFDGTTTTTMVTSTGAFSSISLGDEIEIEMSEVNLSVVATAWNLTTDPTKASPITCTYLFDYFSPTNGTTNYWPAMFVRGGNTVFEEFSCGTTEYKNTEMLLVGDGILQGQRASSYGNGEPNQITIGLGGDSLSQELITKCAIRPSQTHMVIEGLPLLKITNPNWIFIRLGSNDLESSRIDEDSIIVDLQYIVSQLSPYCRKGIAVATPIANDHIDMTSFKNKIISAFTGVARVHVIDCWANSKNNGDPDGPNNFTKTAWLSGSGKLNDLGQDYKAGQPATYSDTNYIIATIYP